jgi:hypothetical protein
MSLPSRGTAPAWHRPPLSSPLDRLNPADSLEVEDRNRRDAAPGVLFWMSLGHGVLQLDRIRRVEHQSRQVQGRRHGAVRLPCTHPRLTTSACRFVRRWEQPTEDAKIDPWRLHGDRSAVGLRLDGEARRAA